MAKDMQQERTSGKQARVYAIVRANVHADRLTWRKHLDHGLAWNAFAIEYEKICDSKIDQTVGFYGFLYSPLRVGIQEYIGKWSVIRESFHSMTFSVLQRVLPSGVSPFQCAIISMAWKAYESIGVLDRMVLSNCNESKVEDDGVDDMGSQVSVDLWKIRHKLDQVQVGLSPEQRETWTKIVNTFCDACLRKSVTTCPELRVLLESLLDAIVNRESAVDTKSAVTAGVVLSEFFGSTRSKNVEIEEALRNVFTVEQLLYAPCGFDTGPLRSISHKSSYHRGLLLNQFENPFESEVPGEMIAALIETQLVHRLFRKVQTGVENGTLNLISITPTTWDNALRSGVRLLQYPAGLNEVSRAFYGFSPWYLCKITCPLGKIKKAPEKKTKAAKKKEASASTSNEQRVFSVCLNEIICHKLFAHSHVPLFNAAYEEMTTLLAKGHEDHIVCASLLWFFIHMGEQMYRKTTADDMNKRTLLESFNFSMTERDDDGRVESPTLNRYVASFQVKNAP
jgi:hypothetical protein